MDHRTKDDPRLLALIDDCMAEVDATVQPRTLERIFPCRVTEDALEVEGFTLKSRRLAQTIAASCSTPHVWTFFSGG